MDTVVVTSAAERAAVAAAPAPAQVSLSQPAAADAPAAAFLEPPDLCAVVPAVPEPGQVGVAFEQRRGLLPRTVAAGTQAGGERKHPRGPHWMLGLELGSGHLAR